MSENHGAVWWSELATRDVEAAKAYYGTVCGWSYDEAPMDGSTYTVAKIGDRMVAGILDMGAIEGMEQLPPHWMTYLAVDDVDNAVEQTRSGGGDVLKEPWDVQGVGRVAMVKDPSGGVVGIMTPAMPPA
jgi:predicted enzyme related to lactoylglutathione lyase